MDEEGFLDSSRPAGREGLNRSFARLYLKVRMLRCDMLQMICCSSRQMMEKAITGLSRQLLRALDEGL